MSTKHTPKLPALESGPTNDTAALTCYALDWREEALKARRQRDDLLAALERAYMALIGYQHRNAIINEAIDAARSAIAKAKGE